MTYFSRLDGLQKHFEQLTEKALVQATHHIKAANISGAKAAWGQATKAFKCLERLRRQRHGERREELELRIRFYRMWQNILLGQTTIMSGEDVKVGRALLDVSRDAVGDMVDAYPDREDFKRLLKIVNAAHGSSK